MLSMLLCQNDLIGLNWSIGLNSNLIWKLGISKQKISDPGNSESDKVIQPYLSSGQSAAVQLFSNFKAEIWISLKPKSKII